MVNLGNKSIKIKLFIFLLTFLSIIACNQLKYYVSKIEGKKIGLTNNLAQNDAIDNFVKPYRDHIDTDLNTILAYCPENLEKSKGKWQTNIGNFLADVTLSKGNTLFFKKENKTIDLCILNYGGIRSIIPKGNVTARNAFEIMPFENTTMVLILKGEQIVELTHYFISEKKPHPLAGITFEVDDTSAQHILIQGKPLENEKEYYVITSDYLANGGDNMLFFMKSIKKYDLNYKLRNIVIDYFKDVDTLVINNDVRVKEVIKL